MKFNRFWLPKIIPNTHKSSEFARNEKEKQSDILNDVIDLITISEANQSTKSSLSNCFQFYSSKKEEAITKQSFRREINTFFFFQKTKYIRIKLKWVVKNGTQIYFGGSDSKE